MTDKAIEQEADPCPNCGGTGRVDPDPAAYGGLRTQGATMDNKIDCPTCHGTGRAAVKNVDEDSA